MTGLPGYTHRGKPNHGRREWRPGEGLPAIWVPPTTLCEDGLPDFIVEGTLIEGPRLDGWKKPELAWFKIQPKNGYPCAIWALKECARWAYRELALGDRLSVKGIAMVIRKPRPGKPVCHKHIVLATRDIQVLPSRLEVYDAERTALLFARILDPVSTTGPGRREPRSVRRARRRREAGLR